MQQLERMLGTEASRAQPDRPQHAGHHLHVGAPLITVKLAPLKKRYQLSAKSPGFEAKNKSDMTTQILIVGCLAGSAVQVYSRSCW